MTTVARGFELLDIRIEPLRPQEATAWIEAAAVRREGGVVHFCNAYTFACAGNNEDIRRALSRGTLNLPDGIGVLAASWMLRAGLPARVPGPDLMHDVLARTGALRHYFLGGTEETLAALVDNVGRNYPQARIAGAESPPFRSLSVEEQRAQVQRIRDSDADIVWVGLGTPKQDIESARLSAEVSAVVVAVGAAFDFLAGTRPRAPQWVRRGGLEWVYRFMTEPRRLWRRYTVGNVQFITMSVREFRARRRPKRD